MSMEKKSELLSPSKFLPRIQSRLAWMILTSYVLEEAVKKINLYQGMCYFSVNLPSAILNNKGLLKIIQRITDNLTNKSFYNKLILEISEESFFLNSETSINNIIELRKEGFKVVIDDCFSKGSVFLPVRLLPFDGFKIDLSITNTFQNCSHSMALLKTIIYYCNLTNALTIAEGVDTYEKFRKLKELGVNQFQGFYIQKPVDDSNLSGTIESLEKQ